MATNFNVSPYYDDFAESKNFHRVLFRPSYAVQGRELTQLQTILQNQVERFGEHVFKDGAMVIPGQATLNTNYQYVKLASHTTSTAASISGTTITGATSGVVAEVTNTSEASSTAAATLYITIQKQELIIHHQFLQRVKQFQEQLLKAQRLLLSLAHLAHLYQQVQMQLVKQVL